MNLVPGCVAVNISPMLAQLRRSHSRIRLIWPLDKLLAAPIQRTWELCGCQAHPAPVSPSPCSMMTVPVCGACGAITMGFMAADATRVDLPRKGVRYTVRTAGCVGAEHCLLMATAPQAMCSTQAETGSRRRREQAMQVVHEPGCRTADRQKLG